MYLYTHIRFSVNKPNFYFKGKSKISTDGCNKIDLSILQFNILNFRIKQFIIFQKFSWNSVQPVCGVIMNLTVISYAKIKYIIPKFPRIRQFSFFMGENRTKSITQKQWKIHSKSVEGSVVQFLFKNPKTH